MGKDNPITALWLHGATAILQSIFTTYGPIVKGNSRVLVTSNGGVDNMDPDKNKRGSIAKEEYAVRP
jgi:hypothetical protein